MFSISILGNIPTLDKKSALCETKCDETLGINFGEQLELNWVNWQMGKDLV